MTTVLFFVVMENNPDYQDVYYSVKETGAMHAPLIYRPAQFVVMLLVAEYSFSIFLARYA
jgi:hypothetical protein